MQTNRSLPRRGERGVALLAIIALLLVFLIFAGAVVVQLRNELNSVHSDGISNRALTAADAGVRGMIVAIEEAIGNGFPDPGPITYNYPEASGPSTVSYTAKIQAKWDPLPAGSRYYLISSTGTVSGHEQASRTVNVMIRAVSSGGFNSASNYSNNQFGIQVWYTPDQQFNGPVYDGGPMHVEYDDKSATSIFQSTVQTPKMPVWRDIQGGTTPTTGADWSSIISGGSTAFAIGVNPIGLPQPKDNLLIASEAYFGNCCSFASYPGVPAGVYMNTADAGAGGGTLTTGIYVQGNATISGTSVGSTETLTIKGGFPTYTVVIDFAAGATTVTKGSAKPVTYSGVPSGDNGPGAGNGAIFVNGNATLMLGTVIQGQYTLTVPDYSAPGTGTQKNIYISGTGGSITYADKTKDELGLWANNVILNTPASNIELDAAIIAGFPGESPTNGGFYNSLCNATTCTAGDQGKLTLLGALMENMHGAVGKFISQTPPVHVGFDKHMFYDGRLSSNPPPFYPVTGNYAIIAWDDLGT